MCFKTVRNLSRSAWGALGVFILISGSWSCSREGKPIRPPMEFSGHLAGCLKGYSQKARDYFDGKLSEKDVSDFFECYHSAVDLFARYVRGSQAGQYKPDEFKVFLETYFMAGEKISSTLVRELVAFHGVILGTPEDVFTDASLARTQTVFAMFKRVALRLRPYMPITPGSLSLRSHAESEAILGEVKKAFEDLGSLFGNAVTNYSRLRFLGLVEESARAFKFSQADASAWRARADILTELKPLLMNSSAEEFQPSDWREYWRRASQLALSTFRTLELLARKPSLTSEDIGVERFKRSFQEFGNLLEEAIRLRPDSVIRFGEFQGLLTKLSDPAAQIGYPLKPETGETAVRALVQIFLGGNDSENTGRSASGLTTLHLRRFQGLLDRWEAMQLASSAAFERLRSLQHPGYTGSLLDLQFKPADVVRTLTTLESQGLIWNDQAGEPARDGYLRDLKTIVSLPVMFKYAVPSAYVGPDLKARFQNLYNLSMWNWIWVFYRAGFVGSATGPGAADPKALTEKEFQSMYDRLWPVAVELKIFDPRVKDSWSKRFREANLFTSVANGDDRLQLTEAVEAATLMFSIKAFSLEIHESMMDLCAAEHAVSGIPDPFGFRQAALKCFQKHYFRNVRDHWKRTPEFLRQYESLAEKGEFEKDILSVANQSKDPHSRLLHNAIDSDSLAMVVYYAESLFVRFDTDKSQRIGRKEAEGMFEVFKEMLRKTASKSFPEDFPPTQDSDELESQYSKLRALLMYALAKGRMPDVTSVSGKIEFLWWWKMASWDDAVNASRATLIRLLEIMRELEASQT